MLYQLIAATFLILSIKSDWHLGLNLNPCDGHNFGYGGPWDDNVDVGSDDQAMTNDFLDNDVWHLTVGYVTIARHVDGTCEMSKTWELHDKTKSMYDYFSNTNPGRIYATGDGTASNPGTHSRADMPATFEGQTTDPIFGAEGGLTFNWWYSNNGARIANEGGYNEGTTLPTNNNDAYHGLGNEFGATTSSGSGSSSWWHDAARLVVQGGSHCNNMVIGTDHGTSSCLGVGNAACWGSYAVYVNDVDEIFTCQGYELGQEVSTPTEAPTADPTSDPTNDPTSDPTADPTKDPTSDPTIDPTIDPTADPTADPTSDPSADPTVDPTNDPTADPTIDPTVDPTADPTIDPTADPTSDPTRDPTDDPTADPTNDPTSDPTKDPTADPTIDPTVDPTADPTIDPTVDPTSDPTVDPTVDPTADPTNDPTTDPTNPPSQTGLNEAFGTTGGGGAGLLSAIIIVVLIIIFCIVLVVLVYMRMTKNMNAITRELTAIVDEKEAGGAATNEQSVNVNVNVSEGNTATEMPIGRTKMGHVQSDESKIEDEIFGDLSNM